MSSWNVKDTEKPLKTFLNFLTKNIKRNKATLNQNKDLTNLMPKEVFLWDEIIRENNLTKRIFIFHHNICFYVPNSICNICNIIYAIVYAYT